MYYTFSRLCDVELSIHEHETQMTKCQFESESTLCVFFLETFLCISRSTTSTTFVPSTVYLAFCIVTVCGQIDCIPDKYSFQNCAIYFSSNE